MGTHSKELGTKSERNGRTCMDSETEKYGTEGELWTEGGLVVRDYISHAQEKAMCVLREAMTVGSREELGHEIKGTRNSGWKTKSNC